MTDEEEDWPEMTGAELAQILALPGQDKALQIALDEAKLQNEQADWLALARAILQPLCPDPDRKILDVTKSKVEALSRLEILADELQRRFFET